MVFSAIFLLAFSSSSFALESWRELKGDHFIIYYQSDKSFANEMLSKSEEYYKQIGDDLGYVRHSGFWQWENRVKIYIYSTQEEFLNATGRQKWSHGVADYKKKEIRSYVWKEGFLESLLPHEIAHLIFRDYVGFKGEIPLWLDEGVAQWQEPAKRVIVKEVMHDALSKEKGYALKDLTGIDIRTVSYAPAVELFYIQAMSVIDFLIKKKGSDVFIFFCRQLRDGKSMDEALQFAYPTSIRDLTELEEQWREYILSA
jgi:hypothetical protein